MMKLSAAFFEAAEREAAFRWDREVAGELMELYPAHFNALGADADVVQAFCRTVRDYAMAYHVTGRRETYRMIVAALALGVHFPHDPRFASLIEQSLAQLDVPQDRRLHLFCDGVEMWVLAADDGAGPDVRGATLVERVRTFAGPVQGVPEREAVAATLRGLVPQAAMALPPIQAAFLDAVLAQADGYGLREPQRRLAYAGGAVLHGTYWFRRSADGPGAGGGGTGDEAGRSLRPSGRLLCRISPDGRSRTAAEPAPAASNRASRKADAQPDGTVGQVCATCPDNWVEAGAIDEGTGQPNPRPGLPHLRPRLRRPRGAGVS